MWLALLVGCSTTDSGSPLSDGPFIVEPVVTSGPLPAPTPVTIPADPEGLDGDALSRIGREVCRTGDPGPLLPWAESHPEAFILTLHDTPILCAALREAVKTQPDWAVQHALATCGNPLDAAIFEGSDPQLKVRWGARLHDRGHPIPMDVWRTAADFMHEDGFDTGLLSTLETDRPELAPLLISMLPHLTNGVARQAFRHQSNPRLPGGLREGKPDPLDDPDLAVRSSWDGALPGLLMRHPTHRGNLLAAVERCASDPSETLSGTCLESLAMFDWSRARRVAQQSPTAFSPTARALQATLVRFETSEAVDGYLDALGFVSDRDHAWPTLPAVSVSHRLHHRGFGTTNASGWGSVHLVDFAQSRIPDLQGLQAEIVEAPWDGDLRGPSHLRIWDGTTRTHAPASDLYEEPRVIVGSLNAILIEKSSTDRVALLDEQGIVFGPENALRVLFDDGLLALVTE